jgi:lambda family phage portal protein
MASARTIGKLHNVPASSSLTPTVLPRQAQGAYPPQYSGYTGSGSPYDATGTGRRLATWQPSRLGPTTSLWSTRDLMLARCHDEVRNNPLAQSAVDNFESQIVGNGIKPKWNNLPEQVKLAIEREFRLSALTKDFDYNGLSDYYGLQALACREVFEGGEVFVRRHIRPVGWSANPNVKQPMRVPCQLQLIEAEQCPIWLNLTATPGPIVAKPGSVVRTGKEFDAQGRLAAFHMYAEHPGETMFFTSTALKFIRVTSDYMLHCYKPFRAGLLRGQPHLASVLVLLHELAKYNDACVVAKEIQAMMAGFVTQVSPEAGVLPTDTPNTVGAPASGYVPPSTRFAEMEPGTMNILLPGEDIRFPNLPQNADLPAFMNVMLHQFAVGVGATYEQITGDLRGVNLSSIRAGVQDAHRKCEQFIFNVLVTQFCQPTLRWWLDEAVLSGRLDLPGYAEEPEKYLDVTWTPSGWPWINPKDDIDAKMTAVRCGFISREAVVAETGEDAAAIDQQQMRDNKRADAAGLVYDSDPRKILVGRESNPQVSEENAPESQEEEQPEKPEAPPAKSGMMRAKERN